MDLVATLRNKIDKVGDGVHSIGLQSVLQHIEVAFRHLTRGQTRNEETAFTDVVYRCNQAFEGSIKEAYRVLAGKNPIHKRPFEIEAYLEENGVFRDRVLAQFTNYRTEWRNPSTHDYNLHFDESEAFLAIVSVAAFACVLIDQLGRNIAHDTAAKEADERSEDLKGAIDPQHSTLMDIATDLLVAFTRTVPPASVQTEIQLMGAITGFFSSVAPYVEAILDHKLSSESYERGDLLLRHLDERVLVELKRTSNRQLLEKGIIQLQSYMEMTGIRDGILFMYPPGGGELKCEEHLVHGGAGRIVSLHAT